MTPIVLVDMLKEFIEDAVKNFELETNVPGMKKAPQVVTGYLKEKNSRGKNSVPDFPYVIIRFLDGVDANEGSKATVRVIAGSYSENEQDGWRDPINILTRIKTELLKQGTFGPFFLEKPIKVELPEEQPFPEWVAFMILTFTMPQVQMEGVIFNEHL